MSYRSELTRAMQLLGSNGAVFIGQAVAAPGTAMFGTLEGVPEEQRIELPVMEDTQMGMATGLSLMGVLPVCIYPRFNFLLLAMNQLVLHLDKLPLYSRYRPKVIIRTAVATPEPMNPGPQHLGNFSRALREMLDTVTMIELQKEEEIMPSYEWALKSEGSTLLIEHTRSYA